MRILIYGSRTWENPGPIEAVILGSLALARSRGEHLIIVHGDNRPGRNRKTPGADYLADRLGRRHGAEVVPVRADWDRYKKGAGPVRNGLMLKDYGPFHAIWGFRMPGDSPGSDDMTEQARKAGYTPFVVTNPAEATPTLF